MFFKGSFIKQSSTVEDKGRLEHRIKNASIIIALKLIPFGEHGNLMRLVSRLKRLLTTLSSLHSALGFVYLSNSD